PNIGIVVDGERLFIDIKAVEGLFIYAQLWPGRVRCLAREGRIEWITYGRWYSREELPFEIVILSPNADSREMAERARDATLLTAGADLHLDLGIVEALG